LRTKGFPAPFCLAGERQRLFVGKNKTMRPAPQRGKNAHLAKKRAQHLPFTMFTATKKGKKIPLRRKRDVH